MNDTSDNESNWWTAFTMGLAGTVLVVGLVGYALVALGGLAITLFIVLTCGGVFLCLCLAELAAAFPEKAGGLPTYAFETFKPCGKVFAQHIGGLSVWGYWFGWFPVAPINAYLAALYIAHLFGIPKGPSFGPISSNFGAAVPINVFLIAIGILCVVFVPCWRGLKMGAEFANIVGVSCMVTLVIVICLPLAHPSRINLANVDLVALPEGVDWSWQLIAGWSFMFTWSVFGFEAAACYIGECREPAKDAKKAMALSGLFGLFVYVGLPAMMLAVLGPTGIRALHTAGDPQVVFGAYVEAIFTSDPGWRGFLQRLVGVTLIANLVMAVLNALGGASRGLMQASIDGVLPRFFQRRNSNGAPAAGIIFSMASSILFLLIGSPVQIYIISNMGYLFAAAVALVGYGIFRFRCDHQVRPFKLPWILGPSALILGMLELLLWLVGGYVASDYAVGEGYHWLFFMGLIALAMYFPLYGLRWLEECEESETSCSSDSSESSCE